MEWGSAATWFAGIGQVMIGLAVAYIAWRQHEVAREKLRLDLFEKRYAVYRAFIDKLRAPMVLVRDESALKIHDTFWEHMLEAKFLFGDDLNSYLSEVWKKSLTLSRPNPRDEDLIELQNWFGEQWENKQVENLFRKYLGFDQAIVKTSKAKRRRQRK